MTHQYLIFVFLVGASACITKRATHDYEDTSYTTTQTVFNILKFAGQYQRPWIPDTVNFRNEYDFIVVGAGSAGCVIANRLSENPKHTVLLLEAGGDKNVAYDIPSVLSFIRSTEANWGHRSEAQDSACLGLIDEKCNLPRGKVLGGSSVLNAMIYTRGNKKDYDHWEELGNTGWGFKDVSKYFQKLENVQIPEYHHSIRGKEGPLIIKHNQYHTPLADVFIAAGKELGYNTDDVNGYSQIGFNYFEYTMQHGMRYSVHRAYLSPISHRKNLDISKNSYVTKLLISPSTKKCFGVKFSKLGRTHHISVKKEVILSAGVFGSPQILMLSGIGPKEHLESLDLPIVQDLKVGHNLQDHIALGGLTFLVNDTVTVNANQVVNSPKELADYFIFGSGPISIPGGTEAFAFLNTKLNHELDYPDIELMFASGSFISDLSIPRTMGLKSVIYNTVYKPIENKNTFTLFPVLLHPKSIGRVMLRSNDPYQLPMIKHNYLTHPNDIEVIVQGIKLAIDLIHTKAFKKYNAKLHDIPLPACENLHFGTNDYWKCAIRELTFTVSHQCCTVKMGPRDDATAVVDPELKVYGIQGLRVIDSSIMPKIPTAHLNGPTIMIAEKGAHIIKRRWN